MNITQTIEIPINRRLIIDVPSQIPTGHVSLTFTARPDANTENTVQEKKKNRKPGCLKGKIWMAEDFDEPLVDFKEYM